jgi:hypothetical protein
MRGIPEFNFPAFEEAAATLRYDGFEVWSPAERDIEILGSRERAVDTENPGRTFKDCMADDLPVVCNSDFIVVLPGWEKSQGAQLEVHVARTLSIPVLAYPDLTIIPTDSEGEPIGTQSESSSVERLWVPDVEGREPIKVPTAFVGDEIRATASTGGQKGQKLERGDLIPAEFRQALGRHYGIGARKYEDHNWARGYPWSWSLAALHRHLAAWEVGEETSIERFVDRETGEELEFEINHIIAVAWHAAALYWFSLHRREHDDRLRPQEVAA